MQTRLSPLEQQTIGRWMTTELANLIQSHNADANRQGLVLLGGGAVALDGSVAITGSPLRASAPQAANDTEVVLLLGAA